MTLEVEGLSHRYGDELVVDNVSLALESGELLGLLGPSGSGKTTIVQIIAGHCQPAEGRIFLCGEDVTTVPPESRDIGLVFQQSSLFPHMTAGENVAYGAATRDVEDPPATIVSRYLKLVGLGNERETHPSELSGGQRRRVELARALATDPDVLLLDEPLSALDRRLRQDLRSEIARIHRETGITTVYVTHDQETALTLADRLVVLQDGQVSERGPPRELYERPPNRFVATFLGDESTLPARVVSDDPPVLEWAGLGFELPAETTVEPGRKRSLHLRPERISRVPDPEQPRRPDESASPGPDSNLATGPDRTASDPTQRKTDPDGTITVTARIEGVVHDGPSTTVQAATADTTFQFLTEGFPGLQVGQTATLRFCVHDLFVFVNGRRLTPVGVEGLHRT